MLRPRSSVRPPVLLALLASCAWMAADEPGKGSAPAAEGRDLAVTPATGNRPDIVLVTLDTVRADRIGAYGHKPARTDTIDALAARGLRFAHCYSPLPLTIPAHATMMTGLYPYHHEIRSNGDNVLAEKFTTLAERLRGAGYATAASVAAFVTTRQWGFQQGFDAYFDSMPQGEGRAADRNYWHTERDGSTVVDDALAWLDVAPRDRPIFLWVHLYDAHYPYQSHPGQDEELAKRPYDAELAYVDDQVGRLEAALAGRDVLWALIGDHGESLGAHGERSHGMYAYDATARVPWILAGPGIPAGVVGAPVSSADLSPTLLYAAGLGVPEGLDGRPQPGSRQVPYVESYQLAERFRIAPHRAVVADHYKLIATPMPELYDLAADPGEQRDLAGGEPERVAAMAALLDSLDATPPGAGGAALDAETLSQLAALGYMGGASTNGIDPLALPDPKMFAELLRAAEAIDPNGAGGPAAVLAEVERLLAMKPDAWDLRMRKLGLLGRMRRTDEARVFADGTAELFPERARTWVTLATMDMGRGDHELALEHARRGLQSEPKDAAARETEVQALIALGKVDEAVKLGEAYMAEDPANHGLAGTLGQHWLENGKLPEAERYLRIAAGGANPRRGVRAQLALLALAAGARGDAYRLVEEEARDFPGNLLARRLLNRMLAEDQRWLDQQEHAAFLVRSLPGEARARLNLAQCLFNLDDFAGARRVLDDALAMDDADPDIMLLHANLLAKEGKRDEGYAIYQAANAKNNERVAAAEARKKERDRGGVGDGLDGARRTKPTPAVPKATP